jgi:hypothetical protein
MDKSRKRGGFRLPRFSRKKSNGRKNHQQEHAKNWVGIQDTTYWNLKPEQWAQIKSISHKFTDKEFVLFDRLQVNNDRKIEHLLVYKYENSFYILCQSGKVYQESQHTINKVNDIFQTLVSRFGQSIHIVLCGHSHGAVSALLSGCYIYKNTSFANLYIVGSAPYKWLSKDNLELLEKNPAFRENIQIYGLNIELNSFNQDNKSCVFYNTQCSGTDLIMSEGGDEDDDGNDTHSQYDAVTKIFKIYRNCNHDSNGVYDNKPIEIDIKAEEHVGVVDKPKNLHKVIKELCITFSHDWKVYRTFFKQFFNFN